MSHSPSYYYLRVKEPTTFNNLRLDYNAYNSRVNPLAYEPFADPSAYWLTGIPQTCGYDEPLVPPFINYQYLRLDQSADIPQSTIEEVFATFVGKDRNLLSSSVSSALNSQFLPIPPTCSSQPEPEPSPEPSPEPEPEPSPEPEPEPSPEPEPGPEPPLSHKFKLGIGQDSAWFFPNPFAEPNGTFKPIYSTPAGEPALQFGEPESKEFIPYQPSYLEPQNVFEVSSILTSNTSTFQPNSDRIPFNASFKGRFLIGGNGNIATIDELTKTIPNMVNYIKGNSCYSGYQIQNTGNVNYNGNNEGIVFAKDGLQAVNYLNMQINTDNSSLINLGTQAGIVQPFIYNFGGASYTRIPTQGTFYMDPYFVTQQEPNSPNTFLPAGYGTSSYIIEPDSALYLEPDKLSPSLYLSQGQDIGNVIQYNVGEPANQQFQPANGYDTTEPNNPGIRYIRDRNDYSQFTIRFTNIEPDVVNNYWIQEPYQFTNGGLADGPVMPKYNLEIQDKWAAEQSQKTIDMTNINYLYTQDKNSDLNCIPLLTEASLQQKFNPNEPLNILVQNIITEAAQKPSEGDTWKIWPTINKQLEPDQVSEPANIGYRFLHSPAFMFSNFMQASKNSKLGKYVQMATEMKINGVPYDYYYLVKEPESFKKIQNKEPNSPGYLQYGADLQDVQLTYTDISAVSNAGSGAGAGSAWYAIISSLFTQNWYSQLANIGDWKDVNYFALEPNQNGSNQLFYRGLEPAEEPALQGATIKGYDPWKPGDAVKNKGPPDLDQLRYNYNLLYVFLGKAYASALNNDPELRIQTRINYETSIPQLFFLGFFSKYWLEEGFFKTSEPEMNEVFRTAKSAGGIMPDGGWTSPIMNTAASYSEPNGGPFGYFYEATLRSGDNFNPSYPNWLEPNNTDGVKGFFRALNNFEGAVNKVRDIINETVITELEPKYLPNLEYTFHTTDGATIIDYNAYHAYDNEPNSGLEPNFQYISPLANPTTSPFNGSNLINNYLHENEPNLPSKTVSGVSFGPDVNDVKSLGSIWYWLNAVPLEPDERNLEPERISIFNEFWGKGKHDQNAYFGSSLFPSYKGGEPQFAGCLEGYDYKKNILFKNENQILAGAVINQLGGTYASNKLIQYSRNNESSSLLSKWKMLGCETSIFSTIRTKISYILL
jgi:hypothetical protein